MLIDDYKSGRPNGYPLPTVTKAVDDFLIQHDNLYKIEWNKNGKGFAVLTKSKEIFTQLSKTPNAGLRSKPWLTEKANLFLEKFFTLNSNAKVLEFGCGASTLWLSKHVMHLVSIEHNKNWAKKISTILKNGIAHGFTDLHLLERPYYQVTSKFPDEYFDLILVDGRDRVKCTESCLKTLKSGGILMLDNAERKNYSQIYEILKNWKFNKTVQTKPDEFGFWYTNWQTNWWIKP